MARLVASNLQVLSCFVLPMPGLGVIIAPNLTFVCGYRPSHGSLPLNCSLSKFEVFGNAI